MPNLQYHLLILAVALFFLAMAWLMLRLAAVATTKQDFLASCLCLGGAVGAGVSVFYMAWLPINQFGCTHEPVWADTMLFNCWYALLASHLVKCWRKPVFLWAVAAVMLCFIEAAVPVKTLLPAFARNLLDCAIGVAFMMSAQVWENPTKILKGNWFSVKSWNDFKR